MAASRPSPKPNGTTTRIGACRAPAALDGHEADGEEEERADQLGGACPQVQWTLHLDLPASRRARAGHASGPSYRRTRGPRHGRVGYPHPRGCAEPARLRGPGPGTALGRGLRLLRGRRLGRADAARERGRVRPADPDPARAGGRGHDRPGHDDAGHGRLPAGGPGPGRAAGPGPSGRRVRAGPRRVARQAHLLPLDVRQPVARDGGRGGARHALVPAVRAARPRPHRRTRGARRRGGLQGPDAHGRPAPGRLPRAGAAGPGAAAG